MIWNLYDPPEDDQGQDTPDPPDDPAELEPARDFPTLTDCPLCGSRDPHTCGCFENPELWPHKED